MYLIWSSRIWGKGFVVRTISERFAQGLLSKHYASWDLNWSLSNGKAMQVSYRVWNVSHPIRCSHSFQRAKTGAQPELGGGIQTSLPHSSQNPTASHQEGEYPLLTWIPTDSQGYCLEIQNELCAEKFFPPDLFILLQIIK